MAAASAQPLPAMNPWLWSQTLGETWSAGLDPQGIGRTQREARLSRLLQWAAEESPLYRERLGRHRGAPPALERLEPVTKAELMHRFDDWATDREIRRASVDDFLGDLAQIAGAYLGRYLVWTSSGTTGEPGIFVQDEPSLAVFDALELLRFHGLGPNAAPLAMWGGGQRYAYVAAIGGHFAGVASIERLRRVGEAAAWPWLRPALRTFSVLQPLPALMRELQAFAPTVLITYPSCADLLAQARLEGRCELAPREIWVGGEQLSNEQRARIGQAFACRIRNNYGASEFYSIAWECAHGQLHLNDDWVIIEPVDRHDRPVPPGEASDAVLLTNLANRAQPLLRYRLGDSVRVAPGRCACGSGFTAIEVQGRADHVLVLHDPAGRQVRLLPLAVETVIEEGAQLTQFQLVGLGPQRLELRLDAGVADRRAAFTRVRAVLGAWLAAQGLPNVRIALGRAPPQQHAGSGKRCRVLAAA